MHIKLTLSTICLKLTDPWIGCDYKLTYKNSPRKWMLIGRMQKHSKEMGLDTQMNVDDTIVIFLQMGFAARRRFRCLTGEAMPQGPQDDVFRALFGTEPKHCQPPHLSAVWWRTKPAVRNTLGFDTRELEQALEDWLGPKEDIDLPSWCSAAEEQTREGRSGTVPSPDTAVPRWHGFVRCCGGVPTFFSVSADNPCCLAGRVWAILGASVTAFCPGVRGKFCYAGDVNVKIAW